MMKPPEQVGAVPQQGVNPQSRDVPQPSTISADDLDYFRHDPEIIAAVAKFAGREVDMSILTDQMVTTIAGMVHKLGVDGAVAEFMRMVPPDDLKRIRRRLAVHPTLSGRNAAQEGGNQ